MPDRLSADIGSVICLHAENAQDGMRLDHFVTQLCPQFSRARVQGLIKEGLLEKSSGQKLNSASYRIRSGDEVLVNVPKPRPAFQQPQDIPLSILFEDDHIIVINKPAGLITHPGAGNPDNTLVNALLHHCKERLSMINGVERPGIVHRLDKYTSGVMVVAKDDQSHRGLAEQFADHGRTNNLKRLYLAFVWGVPNSKTMQIDGPIARDQRNKLKMAVVHGERGKSAITQIEVVRTFPEMAGLAAKASLVRCQLFTGRTHQIRVHLAHIGHPLMVDPLYGGRMKSKANLLPEAACKQLKLMGERHTLHAAALQFTHPVKGQQMEFETALPEDLSRLHKTLEQM